MIPNLGYSNVVNFKFCRMMIYQPCSEDREKDLHKICWFGWLGIIAVEGENVEMSYNKFKMIQKFPTLTSRQMTILFSCV